MSEFNQEKYTALTKEFEDAAKQVANYKPGSERKLPTDPVKKQQRIIEYRDRLISAYNNYIAYLSEFYDRFDLDSQFNANEKIAKFGLKLKKSLRILNLKLNKKVKKFDLLTFDDIVQLEENIESQNDSNIFHSHSNSDSDSESDTHSVSKQATARTNIESESEIGENSGTKTTTSTATNTQTVTATVSAQNENSIQTANPSAQIQDNFVHPNSIPLNTGPAIPSAQIQQNSSLLNNNQPQVTMALGPGDILKGIPYFDSKSQESVNTFIASVDLMYTLSPDSGVTILAIAKTKLVNANKIGSLTNRTWAQIKADITDKYKLTMTFDEAQEKLLAIKQGARESLDTYANRVKSLLDSLNLATTDANADIQASNRKMNESLAIRKFKQNIFDREIRIMAMSTEHTNLVDAISHANIKCEQLSTSNVAQQPQTEKKESNFSKSNNNGNYNKQSNSRSKNEKSGQKTNLFCKYCKLNNHTIENCRRRPQNASKNNAEKSDGRTQNESRTTAVAGRQPEQQRNDEPVVGTSAQLDIQSLTLHPYNHLN